MRSKQLDVFSPEQTAIFLLSRTQRPIILEAELAHKQVAQFRKDYAQRTGEKIRWAKLAERGSIIDFGEGKWGSEFRIYFIKDETIKRQLVRYGYNVENGDVRHEGTYRVNNNSLFWELVQNHGLRLGQNM